MVVEWTAATDRAVVVGIVRGRMDLAAAEEQTSVIARSRPQRVSHSTPPGGWLLARPLSRQQDGAMMRGVRENGKCGTHCGRISTLRARVQAPTG